jgi:hypothetical protein
MIIGSIPFVSAGYKGLKTFLTDRSQTSEAALKSLENIADAMSGPDRDKIDAERVRAIAELTRSMTPFAFVEYLFYATRVVSVFALVIFSLAWMRRDRTTK